MDAIGERHPSPSAALKREADEALFQWYSSKDIEVKGEQTTAQQKASKKKWITIAAASATSILLLDHHSAVLSRMEVRAETVCGGRLQ